MLQQRGQKQEPLSHQTLSPGWGCTPYHGSYGEAPHERGTFYRLHVYEKLTISQVEVYETVGIPVFRNVNGNWINETYFLIIISSNNA